MQLRSRITLQTAVLVALVAGICVQAVHVYAQPSQLSERQVSESPAIQRTATAVDLAFAAAWQAEGVTPALPASDAAILRRLHLDLAGRVPPVSVVRDFLTNDDGRNCDQVVDELLNSPEFVRHFTIVWRNALLPEANSQPQFRRLLPGFEAWLWQHLSSNRPYAEIVRSIITAPLNSDTNSALVATTTPDAFFVSRELKPENLAAATARAFLGVRLDCAECHDHPFDRWTQDQFWNIAAFYAGLPQSEQNSEPVAVRTAPTNLHALKIPGTTRHVEAMFLNGHAPDWSGSDWSAREHLAAWVTAGQNPWFAKMAVNRVWAQFFGRGLVHPVDDFSDSNPASHPEVLELLAADFISSGYDLQHLVRVITATDVYRLSSVQTHVSQQEPQHFARSALRGLTPEQFFDSLAEAVGFYQPYRSDNPFVVDTNSARARFLELFATTAESSLESETTILQALAMMNGDFVDTATSLEDSQTLKAVVEFPAMTDAEKLETLFLASVSRRPSAAEQERLLEYIKSGSPDRTHASALADVFWALLNSSEFLLNH